VRARLKQDSLRGKLPYLSPEQAAMGRVDGRADLFSLGICGCELLAGKRPIDVSDPVALTVAHAGLADRVRGLAEIGVSDETVNLLLDMVALNRSDRCRTAALVAQRGRARLLSLGEASLELTLAHALAPAFDTLEMQAGGFDATLSGLLGPSSGAFEPADVATGTVSLPGFDIGKDVASAGGVPLITAGGTTETGSQGPPVVPLRKRVIFAALSVLALAVVGGWLLGSSGRTDNAAIQPADEVSVATPLTVTLGDQPTVASGAAAGVQDAVSGAGQEDDTDVVDDTSATTATAQADVVAAGDREIGRDQPDVQSVTFSDAKVLAIPSSATKRARLTKASGTLVFLVLPADAEVKVDGKAARGKGGRYHLQLAAGRHRVQVRDSLSGVVRQKMVVLRAGQVVKLPGFQLVTGLP
jgi:hypothetical protein